MDVGQVGQWLAGASAIGTTAFGIVETLKRTNNLGVIGVEHVVNALGKPGQDAFAAFYGEDYDDVIKSAYRGDPKKLGDQLKDAVKTALRDELPAPTAAEAAAAAPPQNSITRQIAAQLGQANILPDIGESVRALEAHNNGTTKLGDADLARYSARVATYTMAIDARVDAGLAAASSHYEAGQRLAAMVVALLLSVAAWATTYGAALGNKWWVFSAPRDMHTLYEALLLGLLAVPIAPIAKDATSLLQTASDVLGRRYRAPTP